MWNGSHFTHSLGIGSFLMVASLAPDVDYCWTGLRRIHGAVQRYSYQYELYASKALSKTPATGPSGPSDTLSRPEQSRNGIDRRAPHSAPHPRTGGRGPHPGAMRKATGAGPHTTGGGGGYATAAGLTLVIGLTGGGAQTWGGHIGGGHPTGPQNARRRGKIGGGGSRIAEATLAGQPRTVPHIAEQILRQAPSPKGRGPQSGGPHTGGAH